MEKVRFRIVHFNNGMHGWGYSEELYKAELDSPEFRGGSFDSRSPRNPQDWANRPEKGIDPFEGTCAAMVALFSPKTRIKV